MKILPFILSTLFLSACRSEPIAVFNLLVTGHGGSGFDTYRNSVPPNTLEAMNRGYFVEGADAVELDIQLTRDSVLVLFHDMTMDAGTDCSGCVSDYSFEEISACRVHTRHGPIDGNYSIPSLEDVFKLLAPTDAVLFLNVKSHDPCAQENLGAYYQKFARALSHLIGSYQIYDRTYVETYDLNFLLACQSVDSSFRFIYDLDDFEQARQTAVEHQFEGFAIVNEAITAEQITRAHQDNLKVIIWGVRILSATKAAVNKNPDAIMTDDIRMLNSVLGR